MKKIYLGFVLSLLLLQLYAQNVTITPNGTILPPITSIPALEYDNLLNLASPKNGDLAYDLTFDVPRVYGRNKWMPTFHKYTDNLPVYAKGIISSGSANNEYARGVGVDSSGNLYLVSRWDNSTFFGGSSDVVLSKYDSKGNEIWFIAMGGPGEDSALELAVDADGNAYITGFFQNSIIFHGKNGQVTKIGVGDNDIFVIKYNTNGVIQWVETAGGTGDDRGLNLALDKNSNVYLTGYFNGTASFGNTQKVSSGERDMFVAKYNSNGIMQWVQSKVGSVQGHEIAVYNNDVYVGGKPTLVKYNADGILQWEKNLPQLTVGGLCVDGAGNVYLGAAFREEFQFEGSTIIPKHIDTQDLLVAKYNSNGTIQRITVNMSFGIEYLEDIVADVNGNIYIIGEVYFRIEFNDENVGYSSLGTTFIFRINTNGKIDSYHVNDPSAEENSGRAIALSKKGQVYAVGYYKGTTKIGENSLTSRGGTDAYISTFDF